MNKRADNYYRKERLLVTIIVDIKYAAANPHARRRVIESLRHDPPYLELTGVGPDGCYGIKSGRSTSIRRARKA